MRVDVAVGVVWEETGSRNIFAGLVDRDVVGLLEVVGNGSEVVGMTCGGDVDFYYPLETISRGRAKQQLRFKEIIGKKIGTDFIPIGKVVEIKAKEAGVLDERLFVALAEGA